MCVPNTVTVDMDRNLFASDNILKLTCTDTCVTNWTPFNYKGKYIKVVSILGLLYEIIIQVK